ncbi:BnaA09g09420D [Brassica napus]|uniref:BnaA09g09420D protein n=1 Tax=Brassica napus TaxID=3708 RepID=A0A078GUZ5_BRANA|nr:BnaA09g09420D [Brassica napus]
MPMFKGVEVVLHVLNIFIFLQFILRMPVTKIYTSQCTLFGTSLAALPARIHRRLLLANLLPSFPLTLLTQPPLSPL